MPRPICLRLFWHCARAAAARTFWTAGTNRAIRMAMIAITTSSSISVKPALRRLRTDAWTIKYSFRSKCYVPGKICETVYSFDCAHSVNNLLMLREALVRGRNPPDRVSHGCENRPGGSRQCATPTLALQRISNQHGRRREVACQLTCPP